MYKIKNPYPDEVKSEDDLFTIDPDEDPVYIKDEQLILPKDSIDKKEYEVTIVETRRKTVVIEAESLYKARELVFDRWRNGEYKLDSDSWARVDFRDRPRITENDIGRYDNLGLSEGQLREVHVAMDEGVSLDILDIIANPEYTAQQMYTLRQSFGEDVSTDALSLVAEGHFNAYEVIEIVTGFRNGLTLEQVVEYAKPEFNEAQMNVIRVGMELGMTKEDIQAFANPEYSWEKMFDLRCRIRRGEKVCLPLDAEVKGAEAIRNKINNENSRENERDLIRETSLV